MTKRVLINQDGLKVSKVGFDVEAAAPVDLLFSSDFTFPEIVERGDVTYTMGQVIAGTAGHVYFNKTYSSPPFVWFAMYDRGVWLPSPNFMHLSAYVETRNSSGSQIRSFHALGEPKTNRINMRFNISQSNNNLGTNLAIRFKYAVLGFQQ